MEIHQFRGVSAPFLHPSTSPPFSSSLQSLSESRRIHTVRLQKELCAVESLKKEGFTIICSYLGSGNQSRAVHNIKESGSPVSVEKAPASSEGSAECAHSSETDSSSSVFTRSGSDSANPSSSSSPVLVVRVAVSKTRILQQLQNRFEARSIGGDASLSNVENSFPSLSSVEFCLHSSRGFPFTPPHIFCMTRFCFPTLNDGRDLIADVCQCLLRNRSNSGGGGNDSSLSNDGFWTPSVTFCEIIGCLPNFVATVFYLNWCSEGGRKDFLYGCIDRSRLIELDWYLRDPTTLVVPFSQKLLHSIETDAKRFAILLSSQQLLIGRKSPLFVVVTEGLLLIVEVVPHTRVLQEAPVSLSTDSSSGASSDTPTKTTNATGLSRWAEVKTWSHLSLLSSVKRKKKSGLIILRFEEQRQPRREEGREYWYEDEEGRGPLLWGGGSGSGFSSNTKQTGDTEQVLVLEDADSFLKTLRRYVLALGGHDCFEALGASNVSSTSPLAKVTEDIASLSKELDMEKNEHDDESSSQLRMEKVQKLMLLYQQKIELHASDEDRSGESKRKYEEAIKEMQQFLQNARVVEELGNKESV